MVAWRAVAFAASVAFATFAAVERVRPGLTGFFGVVRAASCSAGAGGTAAAHVSVEPVEPLAFAVVFVVAVGNSVVAVLQSHSQVPAGSGTVMADSEGALVSVVETMPGPEGC